MRIVSVPRRFRPTGPQPPKGPRSWFLPTGTVAENDGVLWELKRDGDMHGSWRWWSRALSASSTQEGPE